MPPHRKVKVCVLHEVRGGGGIREGNNLKGIECLQIEQAINVFNTLVFGRCLMMKGLA